MTKWTDEKQKRLDELRKKQQAGKLIDEPKELAALILEHYRFKGVLPEKDK